jgi:hypothetical protein
MRVSEKKTKKKLKRNAQKKVRGAAFLDGLIEFLNLDFSSVDPANISLGLFVFLQDVAMDHKAPITDGWFVRESPDRPKVIAAALKLVEPFQQPLIRKLSLFAEVPSRADGKDKKWFLLHRIDNVLVDLAQKLTRWKFQSVFHVENLKYDPLEHLPNNKKTALMVTEARAFTAQRQQHSRSYLNAHHRIFSWGTGQGAGRWIVMQDFVPQFDANRPETCLYAIIARGLISGELALLRRCPHCKKFFLAPDPRTRFLPGHMRLYYDEPSRAKVRVELSRSRT